MNKETENTFLFPYYYNQAYLPLDLISFNRAGRTFSHAYAAVGTKLWIDMRQVIRNCDRTGRTSFFALFTANTANLTDFSSLYTLVVTGTADEYLAGRRNHVNQMIGAFPSAHAASYTFTLIYYGDSVYNMDRVVLAGFHAVAKSQASVRTADPPLIKRVTGRAGFYPFVVHDVIGGIAVTATFNDRELFLNIGCFHAQHCAYRRAYLIPAGNT